MQIRNVTRPAVAAMAVVFIWTASPRAGLAQQCRRTCETGETRDVRGCCVPKAIAAPKPARPAPKPDRPPRAALEAPKAEAPAAKPSGPSAAKPREPPTLGKPEQPQRTRRQRAPEPTTKPAISEPARPVPAMPVPNEQSPRAGMTQPIPVETSAQRPRTDQPPGATAPGNFQTEPPVTTRDEPMAPSRPDRHHPTGASSPMLEPPRVDLAPSTFVEEHEPDRRWPVWMPWAVVGAGATMTGVGGWLYTTASSNYDNFDRAFDASCPGPWGCRDREIPRSLVDRLDRARTFETTSRISLIVGGVTVATGAVLVFLNQSTEPVIERAAAQTFLMPTLAPGAAGITAGMSF
jgi:hypothetical protein